MGEGQESRPWANGCSRCIRRTQFVCYGKTEWNAIHYSYFPNGFASKSTVGDWFATPVLILQMKTNSRWVTQMIAKKIAIKFGIKVIQTRRWEEEKKRKETRKEHLNIPNFIMAWWFQTSGRFPTWTFKGQKKTCCYFFFYSFPLFLPVFFPLENVLFPRHITVILLPKVLFQSGLWSFNQRDSSKKRGVGEGRNTSFGHLCLLVTTRKSPVLFCYTANLSKCEHSHLNINFLAVAAILNSFSGNISIWWLSRSNSNMFDIQIKKTKSNDRIIPRNPLSFITENVMCRLNIKTRKL